MLVLCNVPVRVELHALTFTRIHLPYRSLGSDKSRCIRFVAHGLQAQRASTIVNTQGNRGERVEPSPWSTEFTRDPRDRSDECLRDTKGFEVALFLPSNSVTRRIPSTILLCKSNESLLRDEDSSVHSLLDLSVQTPV